jgi:hypothetical protein
MEYFSYLPQIRISDLEQMVLSNGKKRGGHKKFTSACETLPSIIGSKPSFINSK